jgi:hypothetical protein
VNVLAQKPSSRSGVSLSHSSAAGATAGSTLEPVPTVRVARQALLTIAANANPRQRHRRRVSEKGTFQA